MGNDVPARDPEEVAALFHAAYEEMAPSYGYETRLESRIPWGDVPASNRALMTAVAARVMDELGVPHLRKAPGDGGEDGKLDM